jgi:hypothetical protein
MVMKTYIDAEGNEIEVDDEATLIHGHPDLTPEAPESVTDHRYAPIQYDHTGGPAIPPLPVDPHSLGAQPQPKKQGWGDGKPQPVDSDEFAELLKRKSEGKL